MADTLRMKALVQALREKPPQVSDEDVARAMEFRQSVMYGHADMNPQQAEADRLAGWSRAAGYEPGDIRGGMKGRMASPTRQQRAMDWALGMAPFGATVYHGSPHRFEKFDASKIGTGEGAQAYGHGLYFAENPAVAKDYQSALSGPFTFKGEPFGMLQRNFYDYSKTERRALNAIADNKGDVEAAAKALESQGLQDVADTARGWGAQGFIQKTQGNLYKVDLPDEQIARMLDWDKPLSQQPESVRKALEQYATDLPKRDLSWQMTRTSPPDYAQKLFGPTGSARFGGEPTGEDIYRRLRTLTSGGEAEASQAASGLGIPGIRYFDQGSRAGGEGTSNYVVFNPEILKILRRE